MKIETDEEDDEDNNLSNEDFEEYLNFVIRFKQCLWN